MHLPVNQTKGSFELTEEQVHNAESSILGCLWILEFLTFRATEDEHFLQQRFLRLLDEASDAKGT